MARPGRKPKAAEEKELTGNPGRRSLVTAEPPPDGLMAMPLTVRDNEIAAAYWDWYVNNTIPGHLRPVDSALLGHLCMALAWAQTAEAQVDLEGFITLSPNNVPMQSPWVAIANKQRELARKFAAELCLTPAERNRIEKGLGGGGGSAEDDFFA